MSGICHPVGPDEWPPHHTWRDLRAMLEWTFQVALPADEFGREATAGQLHSLVMRQLERAYELAFGAGGAATAGRDA